MRVRTLKVEGVTFTLDGNINQKLIEIVSLIDNSSIRKRCNIEIESACTIINDRKKLLQSIKDKRGMEHMVGVHEQIIYNKEKDEKRFRDKLQVLDSLHNKGTYQAMVNSLLLAGLVEEV